MRLVIVLFISGLTGLVLTRCASPQLRREIIEAQVENAEAVAVVQKYIPAGAERQRVERALSRSSELLEKTEAARTEAETEIKGLKKYRLWVFAALGSVIGFFLIRRFL